MKCPYPSSIRLKKRWEFDAVFRTGRHQKGELVRIVFLCRPGERTRFGVVVGKKIAHAAGRSRGRRILREALRRLVPWVKDGAWIVVSLREKGLEASARSVYRDLSALMARMEMMSDDWSGFPWSVDET